MTRLVRAHYFCIGFDDNDYGKKWERRTSFFIRFKSNIYIFISN